MNPAETSLSLGDVLLRDGLINQAQHRNALQIQKTASHSMGKILVNLGYISEAVRMGVLQKTFGFDLINLQNIKIDPLVLSLIPPPFAIKHNILPVKQEAGTTLVIAMEDPSDMVVLDAIRSKVGMAVKAYIASSEELSDLIGEHYHSDSDAEPAQEAASRKGGFSRFYNKYGFSLLVFAPVFIVLGLLFFHNPFQNWLSKKSKFDIGLFTLLGWGFWAVILYYIKDVVTQSEDEE